MATEVSTKIRMIASFMQFLTEELGKDALSTEAKESVEVAIQCLEQAYGVNPVDGTLPSKKPILEIFANGLDTTTAQKPAKIISPENKSLADAKKNEGNNLMKENEFEKALEAYTQAIEIDDTNPIYFCNRAAAHSKLNKHQDALNDCQAAIKLDPSYSKAYCRMGLAYVNLDDPQRARDSYKKAVELDPSESNINNLKLAEQKLTEQQAAYGQGFNFANLLNNPALMNMASQMMTDPNMQNMFSNLMGNLGGGGGGPAETVTEAVEEAEPAQATQPPNEGVNAFLQMGQQIAAQLQSQNPQMVEDLKNAFKKNIPDGSDKKEPDSSA